MPGPAAPARAPRRFLADRMLTRLARWLRVAGEDVLAPARPGSHEPARAELRRLARVDGRVVLTRDRSFPGFGAERLVIRATDLDQQLLEFYRAFPGNPLARAFSRCTMCNSPVASVSREAVIAEVPPAVREHGRDFRRCATCGQLYWEGSHSRWIRARLSAVRAALADESRSRASAAGDPSSSLAADDHRGWARFDDFLRLLLDRLNLSWSGYRRPRRSLRAPIVRRMSELGLRDYRQYLDYIEAHFDDEEKRLTEILAVTISRFFRDREDWAHLARLVLPHLAALGRPLRAASLGCASGEEPYTLRLVWERYAREEKGPDDRPAVRPGQRPAPPLAIEAFDVREDLLARALDGVYSASSLHSVPSWFRDRYFVREGSQYRLDRAVVASVRFARLDFFHERIPGPYDLVLCRNVAFTYLGPERQVEVAGRILAALGAAGFLMVGGGERLPAAYGLPAGRRLNRCLYRFEPAEAGGRR